MRISLQIQRLFSDEAWFVAIVLAFLSSWNIAAAQSSEANKSALVVDTLHDALIAVATSNEPLSYEERFQQLQPVIDRTHDFHLIARLVGGRFWKDLNDNERTLFVDAFRRASIATYAGRFVSANGAVFGRARFQGNLGNRATVTSDLIRTDESRVTFDYILHEVDNQWRIITIMVDGVSDLALQRAELTNIYDESGLQGAMKHLDAKSVSN